MPDPKGSAIRFWRRASVRAILRRGNDSVGASTRTVSSSLLFLAAAGILLGGEGRATAASVTLVGGTDDEVVITAGGKTATCYRIVPGGNRVRVHAEGPVVLAIHFRALHAKKGAGTLRIVRDDGPFSDNPFELDRDADALVDPKAAADANAASVERVIHVPVEEGAHRFTLVALKGPPLVVAVYKTPKYDPGLAPQTEKNTGVEPVAEERAPEEPTAAQAAPRNAATAGNPGDASSPPPPVVRASPLDDSMAGPAPTNLSLSYQVQTPTAHTEFTEKAEPVEPPKHPDSFTIAARGGAAIAGGSTGLARGSSAGFFRSRTFEYPAEFEVAWNFGQIVSLYADAEYLEFLRPQHQPATTAPDGPSLDSRTYLQLIPASVGLTALLPFGSAAGLRFRMGAAGAWVMDHVALSTDGGPFQRQAAQHALAYGGVGALSLDVKAGPGHVSLEGRYLLLYSKLGVAGQSPTQPTNPTAGEIGGLQILLGYRLVI